MKIDVLTLFPAMFAGPLDESIIMRARKKGLLDLKIHQLRDWTHDRHKTVDDKPFGGGPGMLMKPEPLFEAVESLKRAETKVILLSPSGRKFDQSIARELAKEKDLLFVTGHYEGFDERVREALADDELSIGDYVLTNGALPAMVVIEDVDLIARDREAMDSACEEALLNSLLNEMDGLKDNADILFVLTTNRPEQLEAALAGLAGALLAVLLVEAGVLLLDQAGQDLAQDRKSVV